MNAALRAVVVQGRLQGSGVILDWRWVLTSAHVIGDEVGAVPWPGLLAAADTPGDVAPSPADVTVAHPDFGVVACSVAWTDPERDVALLYARTCLPSDSSVRLGHLDTAQPLPGCQVVGFPDVQRDAAGRVACDQFTGTVLPAAGRPGDVLTFAFDQPPAVERENGGSPLAGLSGAPVFAGEVLLGIVTRIPRGRAHLRAEGIALAALRDIPCGLPDAEPVDHHLLADVPYEAEYARAVQAAYRRTKVFGLDDLNQRESEWDLDVAYLSLEAEYRRPADSPYTTTRSLPPPSDDRGILDEPDLATGDHAAPTGWGARAQRIDDLLSTRPRVLLRGDAGAGKTTLVWWLAAHAAARTLGPQLAELNGLVPFVVPLRTVRAQNGGFPSPGQLPRAARLWVDQAPEGWAGRVLRAGRALLLVDGLDEVPMADREDAHQWLAGLLRRFPRTRCLVTVRPSAVEPEWLASEGFEELRLLPMRDADIEKFVASWHRAAVRGGDDPGDLWDLEAGLLRQFRQNPILSDLARTPLLCAVICALHRKRQGFLPQTRFKLYQSALDMLLGNRDVRRRVGAPDGISMSVEDHHQILQRVAAWLVRCGQSEFTREQAGRPLESALSGMARVREQGSPDEILTHLLNRSGMLQERSDDSFQFIHRTFQDFLAAKEFVEGGYLGELVRNAADEQWRDVVLLAAGHCNRRDVRALLVGLLERADVAGTADALRADLHVLAARCAEHVVWLEEDVAGRIRENVAALVPPADPDGVRRLVSLGAYVLPLLPGPEGLDEDQAYWTVRVACDIGGSEAIPIVRRFAASSDDFVRSMLTHYWDNFPAEEYAHEVLSIMDAPAVGVTSAPQLEQLHRLPRLRRAVLHGDYSSHTIGRCLQPGLDELSVRANRILTDLGFLGAPGPHEKGRIGEHLKVLVVADCPQLRDVSALADTTLKSLDLDCQHLSRTELQPLRGLAHLRELTLDNLGLRSTDDLPAHSGVARLALYTSQEVELDGLDRWESLNDLSVISSSPVPELLTYVRVRPKITSFAMTMPSLSVLRNESALQHVITLTLYQVSDWAHLPAIPQVFPALTSLHLLFRPRKPGRLDLSPLHALPGLSVSLSGIPDEGIEVVGGEPYGLPR